MNKTTNFPSFNFSFKKTLNVFSALGIALILTLSSCQKDEDEITNLESLESSSSSNISGKSVKLAYNSITATTDDGNVIGNIDDNNMGTRWAGKGTSVSVYIDFGTEVLVDFVNIAFYKGDQRNALFTYWQSTDGNSWNYKGKKTAKGETTDFEEFDLSNMTTRYLRLKFQGNNLSTWNSVYELEVFGTGEAVIIDIPEEEEEEEENNDLDKNKAPSENFDLSQWYLSVPLEASNGYATSINPKDLNNGYELKDEGGKDYFYTNTSDGGMVFKNYPKGGTTTSGTPYTRVELREVLSSDGETYDSSYTSDENNWFFGSSDDIPSKAGGVDGVLTATLKVNHVTETSSSTSQVGRIIIGQIHASKNEPNRLYYHKQPGHSKGAIYVCHEEYNGDETYYNIIGDYANESTGDKAGDYTGAGSPSDGIALNEEFSYEIKVVGNDQWVTISRPNKTDIVTYIDMKNSGYEDDWMYFKAGIYSQNKTVSDSNDYDQVTFYSLQNKH